MLRLLCVTVVFVLHSATLYAQDEREPEESAADFFARGQQAFGERDFVLALELFRQAHDRRPHDAVLYNVGLSLERLGRYVEAIDVYESLRTSAVLDAATLQDAQERRDAAEARVATIQVSGWIGAELWVDGQSRCTIPCDARVDPGRRALRAQLGDLEWSEPIDVRASETRRIRARAPAAPITVETPEVEVAPVEGMPPTERGIGWLGVLGASTAIVGGAGLVGFGVRTNTLAEEYRSSTLPSGHPDLNSLEDNTRRMARFTNASIGVAVVGAVLLAIDVILSVRRR